MGFCEGAFSANIGRNGKKPNQVFQKKVKKLDGENIQRLSKQANKATQANKNNLPCYLDHLLPVSLYRAKGFLTRLKTTRLFSMD